MRGICNRSLRMYSFNLQAPVGRRVDNAIHLIKIYPVYSAASFFGIIRWIAIYPSDSVILPSNNWARSIIITQIYKQKLLNNLTCVKQRDSVFCFDENTERDCVLEFICACRYEELMNRNVITFEIWNIVLTILMCSLISVICHRSVPFDCKRQNFNTVHRKFVKIGELCRGYHACYI